jgi:NAD(P)-dependent dehydrogenase (short-subunit alcohol dehydrogenase family)
VTTARPTREFTGRTALVTGSGQGIGAAVAEALAARGCAIALHDRVASDGLAARARTLAETHAVEVAALTGDLARTRAAAELFEAFDARFSGIDILVNNAGYETNAAAEDLAEADWRGVLEVNLTAPFLLAQQAARRMRGKGGVIVNVSSIHDRVPRKGLAHYATAKAGLAMLTRSLALEWAEYGIRVVSVAPGAVETEMNRAAIEGFGRDRFEGWIPAGRLGHTADVAAVVAFLCSDAASYVTGAELAIDGGYALNLVRYDDRPGRRGTSS